jgi:hypothetical protein
MINFIAENGAKVLIDPDDVAVVSSTNDPRMVELMFMDGTKLCVFGTMADVTAKVEGDKDAE